ncbi:MAG: transcriptional repressor [Elusimicrobia bacterium]|nr:transcriptional repressor [Elusimicrobiota bacterium]
MTEEKKIFRDYVKSRGLKHTAQRDEILTYLLKSGRHMSPEEVFHTLRERDPKLGRATVFRTLKLLEECRLASRVTDANGHQTYEGSYGKPHHDHMICVRCGRTVEFSSPRIESLQARIARRKGFQVQWHRHEIFGRCSRCENKI